MSHWYPIFVQSLLFNMFVLTIFLAVKNGAYAKSIHAAT